MTEPRDARPVAADPAAPKAPAPPAASGAEARAGSPAPAPATWRQRLTRGQDARAWLAELVKFAGVGGTAYVVDVGLFNLLAYGPGQVLGGRLVAAKAISASVSILVAWLGNRLWTFRQGRRRRPTGELALFVAVNLVAMGVTLATLAVAVHVLGVTSPLGVNLAGNVVGVALGTLVRYTCYRYLVFTGDGGAARR